MAKNIEPEKIEPKRIEFYFDFSSPYGYFASHRIDRLAASLGRTALWKPFMLGAVFKRNGNRPLIEQPIKGAYSRHDWERLARFMEVPWVLPERFPIAALAPSRAFYWLFDRDPEGAKAFARAAFHAYFAEGRDISSVDAVADLAAGQGADRAAVLAALDDPAHKERLRRETDEALERGVCGSPYFIIDGEGFWGSDRLWMVKKWAASGGW